MIAAWIFDRYTLAMRRQVRDEECLLGVSDGFIGSATVRAEPGNDARLCLYMVVGTGCLEVRHSQASEIKDIDGHMQGSDGVSRQAN